MLQVNKNKYVEDLITVIKRIYTHFTHVTVVMCNLGPGHSNEVVGHEDRYA